MADYIGATPMQSPIMGLLAERLKQAQQFAAKPFGYQNPPAEMLMNLLGIPAVQQTAERMAYGEPLTTGRGMTTQIRPEALEAAMVVAPVGGLLGRGVERGAMAAGRAGERLAERVVPQIMDAGGRPAQLLQDLGQGSIRPMDVWHGSPHGPFPKFDSSKIGTGEGAQAYGHGLYTGEARGTGEEYRKVLTGNQYGDKLVPTVDGIPSDTPILRNLVRNGQSPEDFIASMQNKLKSQEAALSKASKEEILPGVSDYDMAEMALGETKKLLDEAKGYVGKEIKAEPVGFLYKVDLPDEAIAKMLDFDKPVSKQPTVMSALRSEAEQRVRDRKLADIENDIRASLPKQDIGNDYMAMFSDANVAVNQDVQAKALAKLNKMDLKDLVDKELDSMKPLDMNWNMTGKEFYELLSKRTGSPEKASAMLQAQGVTGNRYLDQGSRNYESGTSNFVVYPGNEDLLRIIEINDKPYEQWFPKANLLD
jgi:hypothetical protein